MPSLGLKLPQVAACRRRVRGPVVPDLPIWRAARAAVAAVERQGRRLCQGESAGEGTAAAVARGGVETVLGQKFGLRRL